MLHRVPTEGVNLEKSDHIIGHLNKMTLPTRGCKFVKLRSLLVEQVGLAPSALRVGLSAKT